MKYVACARAKIVIGFEKEDGKIVWGKCVGDESKKISGQAVYDFAKKTFRRGDEVNVDFTVVKNEMLVKRVEAVKGSKREESVPVTTAPREVKTTSVKDQKVLKDLDLPVYDYPRGYMSPKTPEESAQIRKLALISSTSDIVAGMLTALTGQADPNSLSEVTKQYIKEIFETLNNL